MSSADVCRPMSHQGASVRMAARSLSIDVDLEVDAARDCRDDATKIVQAFDRLSVESRYYHAV
jgi:hypothetical protein